ncbi:MAG: PEP-CTERM sorting domain-containing protein [Akkermansia sp.]|nr:PEP-CTERM sorting domain-containing protein [Akkermansia sp.]
MAVTGAEYLLAGKYQLIHDSAYNAADWSSDVLSITGCDDGNLAWENGVLTLTCTNAWNQAAEDGATISSIAGNLVVMGGAGIIFNGVLSVDAAQQGQGHLIIDSGVAYLEQGANVEGNVVFTGTQQADRTLVAEVDTSLNCVVLATAQSESSSIEVSNGQEVELASVAGTGSLTKDGAGTLTHTGESTGVQGNLVVNEGKLLNSGTLAFDKIELNGGQLENQGTITGVEINGGILSGSGVFGGLTMKAGQLVVGNSPGFQQYTDALRAEGGELVFSVGGVAEAATSTCKGWESTVYSNIDMGGNELHLGADTTLTIAMGGSMLENLTGDFSMVLFSNVGNIDSFTDGVLATLLENTRFIVTDEEAGVREGWEAGADLSSLVQNVAYSVSGTSLVLSGQFAAVPEPATATLSLLALAGLVMRRRRR